MLKNNPPNKMTTKRLLGFAAIGLLCVSCGKIRDLASKAKSLIGAGVASANKSAGTTPDPALQALVDQTPEGAVFRKDLPFPEQVQVKMERRLTFDAARIFVKSAIGNQAANISGTQSCTMLYERAQNRIAVTMQNSGFASPQSDKTPTGKAQPDKAPTVKAQPDKAPTGKPQPCQAPTGKVADAAPVAVEDDLIKIKDLSGGKISFANNGKAWKAAHATDFKLAAWGSNLEPNIGAICMHAGVLPRSYWFGQNRIKPGDNVPLTGAALALLLGDGATGAVTLKLESFEASGGHPCGVFSVTGNYHAPAMPSPDGTVCDNEVSIISGKAWLSLIYPTVIREQLETVQTIVTGAGSSHSTRIQGKVHVEITREWKPTGTATQ